MLAKRAVRYTTTRLATNMSYTYKYPRPGMTVDACIVAEPQQTQPAQVLLIQRQKPPCQGMWALPGGFVDENEPLDKAAARELQEETSLDPKDLLFFQVGAFGDPGRDPRGWAVSAAYAALIPNAEAVKGGDDAAEAQWFSVTEVPTMAFDHKLIVRTAFEKLLEQKDGQGKGALQQQLQQGIKHLAGPWTPPKE